MKKKILVVLLILILSAVAVTGSLAYFMTSDEAVNVMSFGSVEVVQHEQEHDEQGDLQDFTQDQIMMPVVDAEHPQQDDYYIEKLVSVENTGTNDAYVRTFIAYPSSLEKILVLDVEDSGIWQKDEIQWQNTWIAGKEYRVISYTYSNSLKKAQRTEYLLKGVYLDASTDAQVNPESNVKEFCVMNPDGSYDYFGFSIEDPICVYVMTQASQTSGLSEIPQEALNTAFGNQTPDFNQE